jgi:hypothetical protein
MHVTAKGLANECTSTFSATRPIAGLGIRRRPWVERRGPPLWLPDVPVMREAKPGDRGTPARVEVETGEAEIVREIDGEQDGQLV